MTSNNNSSSSSWCFFSDYPFGSNEEGNIVVFILHSADGIRIYLIYFIIFIMSLSLSFSAMLYYAMLFIVGFSTIRIYQPKQKREKAKEDSLVCVCVYICEKYLFVIAERSSMKQTTLLTKIKTAT